MKSFVVLCVLHYLKLRLSFLGCTLILPQRLIWEVLYTSESIFRVFLLLSRAPYLPASRHCSVFVSSAWLARLMAMFSIRIQYHFRLLSLSLSRSSWLLLSVLILALDSSFCKFVPWKRFVKSMGPSHRKLTKNNLASFCLWPPCCATPSRSRRAYAPASNTANHDNHEKINSWVSFVFLYSYGAPRSSAINWEWGQLPESWIFSLFFNLLYTSTLGEFNSRGIIWRNLVTD